MTGYETWSIGGVSVPHVQTVAHDPKEGIITLSCSALNWNQLEGDTDPRDEIARFEALSTQYINNNKLLNGGSQLIIGNGQYVAVTDGTDTWDTCALERVNINEDNTSEKRIDYELIVHYELPQAEVVSVYTPPFTNPAYTNMEYYYFYDPGPPEVKTADTGALNGTELGWMQITETANVKRVEVYGCGCDVPGSKIYVNGVEQIWHYGEDPSNPVGLSTGTEKFTWDLATPTNIITIKTTIHTSSAGENYGAWLQWIKLIFD
jgi:hypothetical protein